MQCDQSVLSEYVLTMTNKLFAIQLPNILHAISLPMNTDHASKLTRTVTVYKVNTNC